MRNMGGTQDCTARNCTTRAKYGFPNQKAVFCASHKQEGMVHVEAKRCEIEGCDVIVTRKNAEGKLLCKNHNPLHVAPTKAEKPGRVYGPIPKPGKYCKEPSCMLKCNYGEMAGKPEYCSQHKTASMVNLTALICQAHGCLKGASFGDDKTPRQFCAEHKKKDMVSVKRHVCISKDCETRASYGPVGEKPTRCAKHKITGMVNTVSRICEEEGCSKYACFGHLNEKPIRCSTHADLNMVDLVNATCAAEGCNVRIHPENNDFKFCATHDTENLRHSKVREISVAKLLQDNNKIWTSWNKEPQDIRLCGGMYKPDFTFETPTHVVIIEVDELQHAQPGYKCDNKRMLDIFNSYGGLPLHFIRFNPDRWKLAGLAQNTQMKTRYRNLLRVLDSALNKHPSDNPFVITRLYYDNSERALVTTLVQLEGGEFKEVTYPA